MRHFIFTWAAIEKHGKAVMRNNKITVSNTTGDIGHDAKSAVNIFTANFGNLKFSQFRKLIKMVNQLESQFFQQREKMQ